VAAVSATVVFRMMMTSLSVRGWGFGTSGSGVFFFFLCSTVVKGLLTVNSPSPQLMRSAQDRCFGASCQGQRCLGAGFPERLVVGAFGCSGHGGAVGPCFWEPLPCGWVGAGEALSS
jgi:hypothetical protein